MKLARSLRPHVGAFFAPILAAFALVMAFLAIAVNNAAASMGFGTVTVALGVTSLTNLVPDSYAALKVVSREFAGMIPSVNRDAKADQVALNQSLRSAVAPVNSSGADIVPAMAFPTANEQTIGNVPFTIQKSRFFPFTWSGEDQYSANQGPGALTINQQQIAQALRAAVAEISAHGYGILRAGASRATGTAGTTPFATNLDESADVRKILDDNGTPANDRSLVVNTSASANIRKRTGGLLNANPAITADVLTNGVLIDINGFKIREEAKIVSVASGTAAAATTNAAGYAVGATVLTLAAVGTGTILAGDVLTFAGDTNKYVVVSGDADVSNGGTITIADPGLQIAMSAATKAITVGAAATANLAFSRDFAILGTRLPAVPTPKDMAIIREVITDPLTNLSFELTAWAGQRMVTFQIAICWGWAVENPEHGALLLG